MKSKASSLRRSIKSTDFYPDWWRKKREKSQIINTRNGRGDITNSKYVIDSEE